MSLRRVHTLALAIAGVLLGHIVGYTAADPAGAAGEMALGGHTYMGPVVAVGVPLGLLALLALAVRSVRRNGRGLPTARDLVVAQIGLFTVQEFVERIPGPVSPWSAFGERAVWFGFVAQIFIAWGVARLLHWTARVMRQVVQGARRRTSRSSILPVRWSDLSLPGTAMVPGLPYRRGPPLLGGSFSSSFGPVMR